MLSTKKEKSTIVETTKSKKLPLADNIKNRRKQLGLSLEALAQRCGVSRAMLSDIEREAKNPTIAITCQIAEGLNCTVSELLGEEKPAQALPWQVIRQSEQQVLVDPHSGVTRRMLDPTMLSRGLEVVWYSIPAGRDTGDFPPHQRGVVEHITVIQGQLVCILDHQELQLTTGDSLFFQAHLTHRFYNPGPDICHYLLLIDDKRS